MSSEYFYLGVAGENEFSLHNLNQEPEFWAHVFGMDGDDFYAPASPALPEPTSPAAPTAFQQQDTAAESAPDDELWAELFGTDDEDLYAPASPKPTSLAAPAASQQQVTAAESASDFDGLFKPAVEENEVAWKVAAPQDVAARSESVANLPAEEATNPQQQVTAADMIAAHAAKIPPVIAPVEAALKVAAPRDLAAATESTANTNVRAVCGLALPGKGRFVDPAAEKAKDAAAAALQTQKSADKQPPAGLVAPEPAADTESITKAPVQDLESVTPPLEASPEADSPPPAGPAARKGRSPSRDGSIPCPYRHRFPDSGQTCADKLFASAHTLENHLYKVHCVFKPSNRHVTQACGWCGHRFVNFAAWKKHDLPGCKGERGRQLLIPEEEWPKTPQQVQAIFNPVAASGDIRLPTTPAIQEPVVVPESPRGTKRRADDDDDDIIFVRAQPAPFAHRPAAPAMQMAPQQPAVPLMQQWYGAEMAANASGLQGQRRYFFPTQFSGPHFPPPPSEQFGRRDSMAGMLANEHSLQPELFPGFSAVNVTPRPPPLVGLPISEAQLWMEMENRRLEREADERLRWAWQQ